MNARATVPLLLLVQVVLLPAADVDDLIQDFVLEFSGVFNDKHQVQVDSDKHDVMEFTVTPVEVPTLKPAEALYFVERVNGKLYRRMVLAVTQNDKKTLFITQYNISESSHPRSSDLNPADVSTFTIDDLETSPGCNAVFIQVVPKVSSGPKVFSGNWADCRHTVNGEHPLYLFTVTCEGVDVDPPLSADERPTIVPYKLMRVAASPRPAAIPVGYVGPCDNTKKT